MDQGNKFTNHLDRKYFLRVSSTLQAELKSCCEFAGSLHQGCVVLITCTVVLAVK